MSEVRGDEEQRKINEKNNEGRRRKLSELCDEEHKKSS